MSMAWTVPPRAATCNGCFRSTLNNVEKIRRENCEHTSRENALFAGKPPSSLRKDRPVWALFRLRAVSKFADFLLVYRCGPFSAVSKPIFARTERASRAGPPRTDVFTFDPCFFSLFSNFFFFGTPTAPHVPEALPPIAAALLRAIAAHGDGREGNHQT